VGCSATTQVQAAQPTNLALTEPTRRTSSGDAALAKTGEFTKTAGAVMRGVAFASKAAFVGLVLQLWVMASLSRSPAAMPQEGKTFSGEELMRDGIIPSCKKALEACALELVPWNKRLL
jgi:hypothetical protein